MSTVEEVDKFLMDVKWFDTWKIETKVRVTRFECFHVSAHWKREQKQYFYLELARDGTKKEKESRKNFAHLLGSYKQTDFEKSRLYHGNVEGTGFIWRVEATVLRKYADKLDLPCTVDEEIARFKREGARRPSEPIPVHRIYIHKLGKPHLVTLQIPATNEQLRRAIEQYVEHHWQARDDWFAINAYGNSITITRVILQEFIDWFDFVKPLDEMLAEAMQAAKEAEENRAQWEASDEYKRWKQEQQQRTYSQYEYSYRNYQPSYTPPLSVLESALEIFSLDRSVANKDTVKKRYRDLAKLHHPDVGGDVDQMKKLNNANEVLMQHFA